MGSSFEEALSQVKQLNSIYTTLEIIKEEVKGEQTVSEVINQNKLEITQLENDNKKLELEKIGLTLLGKLEEVEKIDSQIQSNKYKINELKLENTFLQGILKLYENSPIDTILNILDRMSNGSVKESYAQLLQLQDGEKQLKEGLKQLEQAKVELEDGKRQLEEGKKELEKGKNEYYKGLKELKKAQATLDEENEKATTSLTAAGILGVYKEKLKIFDNAFTTDAPTPCKPPETLYPLPPNLPPACKTVYTVSTVESPVFG